MAESPTKMAESPTKMAEPPTKMAEPKVKTAELPLDIHELFRHYNALYFDDALGACTVTWSRKLKRIIGTCHFVKADLCKILLSESLLKPRSSVDLKNYLLHEMIHAFLWIKEKTKDRSQHGPNFWNKANDINSDFKDDHERPSDGYRITDQHVFHYEAETCTVQQRMSRSCVGLIKRERTTGPSSDCLEKTSNDADCSKLSCQWHRDVKKCSCQYTEVDVSGFRDFL